MVGIGDRGAMFLAVHAAVPFTMCVAVLNVMLVTVFSWMFVAVAVVVGLHVLPLLMSDVGSDGLAIR